MAAKFYLIANYMGTHRILLHTRLKNLIANNIFHIWNPYPSQNSSYSNNNQDILVHITLVVGIYVQCIVYRLEIGDSYNLTKFFLLIPIDPSIPSRPNKYISNNPQQMDQVETSGSIPTRAYTIHLLKITSLNTPYYTFYITQITGFMINCLYR